MSPIRVTGERIGRETEGPLHELLAGEPRWDGCRCASLPQSRSGIEDLDQLGAPLRQTKQMRYRSWRARVLGSFIERKPYHYLSILRLYIYGYNARSRLTFGDSCRLMHMYSILPGWDLAPFGRPMPGADFGSYSLRAPARLSRRAEWRHVCRLDQAE